MFIDDMQQFESSIFLLTTVVLVLWIEHLWTLHGRHLTSSYTLC